jgi:hypothetical protein
MLSANHSEAVHHASFLPTALAQTNIDSVNKFSWSENCGYMNWADAGSPAGARAARININAGFAEGFVWCENIGWINLGNGGGPYANTTGLNFGVNVDQATGAMSGLAWGENVGWINFSGGALATPAQPARLDTVAGRLRGYAWGENIGWINLDVATAGKFVGVGPIPCNDVDFNNNDVFPEDQDILDFFNVLAGGSCPACDTVDFNNNGVFPEDQDILDFFNVLAGGTCP